MLAKLNLDRGNGYQQSIATYEIAVMLVDFVLGRKHYLRVGSESGGITNWDDIVIEKEQNYFIHMQVKRQTSAGFGNEIDTCERNEILRGVRKGQKRDLSELDETLKSLADWFKDVDITAISPKREFWIELPELNTEIKAGLQVKHLKDLCEDKIKPAVTTVNDLLSLEAEDKDAKNCFNWLHSWCDFQDWGHVLKVLQFLKIKDSGTETEIESKTEEKLKDIFISDKVRDVRLKILSYLADNTTFTGAISPRNLLYEVQENLLSTIPFWTQYENNNLKWDISGTQDLEFNNQIERSKIIVPHLWADDPAIRHLKIHAPFKFECKLSESILRLAIHQSGVKNSQFTHRGDWQNSLQTKIGNTLGISDIDINNLNIIDNNELYTTSENHPLDSLQKTDDAAKELHDQMLAETWKAVKQSVGDKILAMPTTVCNDLKYAVDGRWQIWIVALDSSQDEVRTLFKNMVHPRAEGEDIKSDLRIGKKTVNILADAMHFLLIVSVCLNNDANGNWKKLKDGYHANTIAIEYWSGVSGKPRVISQIADGFEDIAGKESCDLLILPKVKEAVSEILGTKMDGSKRQLNTLADGKFLKGVITSNTYVRKLINNGDIGELKKYFESIIN